MKKYLKLVLGALGTLELVLLFFWTISLFFYVISDIEGTFLIQKAIYFFWLIPFALFLKDKEVQDMLMSWGDKIFSN